MDTVHMTLSEVRALTLKVLKKHGCDDANAEAVADNMTGAERDHATSHGVFRLPGHVTSLGNGKVNGKAAPSLSRPSPGAVRVDGDGGFAPLAFRLGKDALVEAARENGIAVLAIVNTFHFAALWPETSALAEEGLVALAVTSSPPYVAAAGGKRPFFGTNPMSFAWPRKDGPPMAFDQAAAAMARGEIMIHARDGHEVPDGVGIDAGGNPTRDPEAILKGAQLTFGGYKGSAIALMIDLLAGPLIEPGQMSPSPNVEASFSPTEGSAEGIIVADAGIPYIDIGILSEPVTATVKSGRRPLSWTATSIWKKVR